MNTKTLLSAFALVAFLSCQNQSEAPSAPQGETGTLALRVVSAKALAQVDSVSVRLSWGSDSPLVRTAHWSAPSIKLDGLPLGVRIAVHMEGWNDERGRKVVVWSGDAYAQLTGDANWDLNNEAPIVIVSAAPAASPNLSTLLPAGYALVGDSLRLLLGSGKTDTIRLGGQGVDSILVDDKYLVAVEGKYVIVLAPGDRHQVVVVGTNGMTSAFLVTAVAKLPSARELVVANAARSWSNDTLSFSLLDGTSDTVRIGTSGVDSVSVNGTKVQPAGASYGIVATAPGSYEVVAFGAAGQSARFKVVVGAIPKAEVKPGLVVDFKPVLPNWAGAKCSLRVAMDSGKVDRVVMLEPDSVEFTKVNDSLWILDWTTKGASDSLKVRVYGQGSKGTDSVNLVRYMSFDREAPMIRIANLSNKGFLFGKAGGTVSWKAIDRGLATTWATDTGDAKVMCSGDTCLATGVRKSFVIHAKDELGNDTSVNVAVSIDDAGPSLTSVKDVAGTDLGKGDTLWIDSAVGNGTVVVSASDDLSGMVIVAARAVPQGAIQERISSGSTTISGLTVGTWSLRAIDDLGNETPWGDLVVAIRKPGAVVRLGAYLKTLPTWVGASCSVQVVVTSGTIDTVVADGIQFVSSGNKTIWTAVWTPSKSDGEDSLKIMVRGQGSKGSESLSLTGFASIDRTGPTITQKSVLRNGVLRVGRSGGELAVSVQDPRGLDSVWLKGGGKIVLASGDSLHRATVQKTDTVMALDSLGNVQSLPVKVVVDSTAPGNVTLEDGLKRPLSDSGFVHRDSLTAVAKLVVNATDSSGFLVRLMNGTTPIRTVAGLNGVATLDSLPVGFLTVVVEDSLGNRFVRNGKQAWGVVVVRIRPPTLDKKAGTYGAEETKYVDLAGWVDALALNVTCPDGGDVWVKSNEDTASVAWQKGWTSVAGSATWDFRCVYKTDTSEIVTRTYNVLQRPSVKQNDTTFTSTSFHIGIVPSSNATSNPAGAEIQYCLGDSLTCVGTTWKTYMDPVVITTTTTLWARVAYDGKFSRVVKRTYTKADGVVNWTRNFTLADAPLVTDTAGLRKNYQIHAWSGKSFDTLSVTKKSNPALRLDMKWLIANRAKALWGTFGADFFLDESYSTYDFTDADSIVFDYTATGTMTALHIYPVDASGQGSDDALQYAVNVTGTSHHVSIDLVKGAELAYPSWGNVSADSQKKWDDIKGAIKSLRFFVEPTSTSADVPTEATTSLSISKVTIYGTIRKK